MENNYIEQKKNTHLYFQIGESKYAINTDNILEIIKLPALDYPQKLPHNILGLLKYNSFVINVIDIRFFLNINVPKYTVNNELLILKTDEVIFGMIVDKICGLLPIESAKIDQIPFIDTHMFIESLYKYNDETIYNIDVYSLESMLKSHDAKDEATTDVTELFPQDEKSKAIMVKRASDMIEKKSMLYLASGNYIKNKYLSINLNENYYCIPLDSIKEIVKDISVTKIPGTTSCIDGITNLRGDDIAVINLKEMLSIPDNTNSNTTNETKPAIIVETQELILALLADKINEIFEYDEITQDLSGNYYSSEFLYNESLYSVLNIEKIASDKKINIFDT